MHGSGSSIARFTAVALLAASTALASAPRDRDGEVQAILERARAYRQHHGVNGQLTSTQQLARTRFGYQRWLAKTGGHTGEGWVSLGPSNGAGRCTAIAPHPTIDGTLLVGAAGGGVWKTVDSGATWFPLTDGLPDLSVGAVAYAPSNPDVVYVGTGEGGIAIDFIPGIGLLRSDDGGETWLLPTDAVASRFFALSVDPADPDRLLAATNEGLLASSDGGQSWDNRLWAPSLIAVTEVTRAALDPDLLFATPWCFSSCPDGIARVMRSTDRGLTWSPAAAGLPEADEYQVVLNRTAVTVAASDPRVLYAGLNAGVMGTGEPASRLFASTDGGDSWHDTGYLGAYLGVQGWYDNAIAVHPTDPEVVVAAGVAYEISHDGGRSWVAADPYADGDDGMGSATVPHVDGQDLVWQGDTAWLACDGGVWASTDRGLTWSARNLGLVTRQFYGIALDPMRRERVLGGTQDNATNLRRDSGDGAWDVVIGSDGFQCAVNPLIPDWLFGTLYHTRVFRNTSGGQGEWRELGPSTGGDSTPFITPLTIRQGRPWELFTGSSSVWRTTDAGESWARLPTQVTQGAWSGAVVTGIALTPAEEELLMVGKGNELYRSSDGGGSWQVTLVDTQVNGIAISPSDPTVALLCLAQTPSGQDQLLRTTDGGESWHPAGAGLPPFAVHVARFDPTDAATVFAGTDVGLYRSTDAGLTWSEVGDGLPAASVYDVQLLPDGSRLTVATHGRGVWELAMPPSTNDAPTVVITSPAGATTVALGQQVTFAASALDPEGDQLDLTWVFTDRWDTVNGGHGYGSLDSETVHAFTRSGRFTAAAHVADEHGAAGFATVEVTAGEPADDCATPRVIPPDGPFPVTVVTENDSASTAASDPVPACASGDEPDSGRIGSLWFELTPQVTATYVVATCGSTADTVLSAWTGPPCGPYQAVEAGCSDDDDFAHCSSSHKDSYLELPLAAGTTYRFLVGSWGQSWTGEVRLTVDCAGCSPPDATHTSFVPAAAHAAGYGGTFWVSDLDLFNPTAAELAVELTFLPATGAAPLPVAIQLAAGETRRLPDVVDATFHTSGSGAIRIEAGGELLASSRTFTSSAGGSFGQGIPAEPESSALPPAGVSRLIGFAGSQARRTNLGLLNLDETDASAHLELLAPDGSELVTADESLPPHGWRQLNRVLGPEGPAGGEGTIAVVTNTSQSARLFAYASVVDEQTGDPSYVTVPDVATEGSPLWIAAAAHVAGEGGTDWRTDLYLTNISNTGLFAVVELFGPDPAAGERPRRAVFVPEGESVPLADVVGQSLDAEGAGALRVTVDRGHLLASSTTYTVSGAGSYGQRIPGIGEGGALTGSDTGVLLGLRQDGGFRTNLGLVNLADEPLAVEVRFAGAAGDVLSTLPLTVAASSWLQVNRAAPAGAAVALLDSPTAGARYLAYASVVDNRTGDPTYLQAVRLANKISPKR